jgi:hypothetical protein
MHPHRRAIRTILRWGPVGLLSCLCACSLPRQDLPRLPPAPLAVWSYLDLAQPGAVQSGFFAFAAERRIGALYLGASGRLPGESGALGAFIQAAHARGIGVSLVLGRAGWARPERRPEALAQVRAVRDFARALREAGRVPPAALQLDVEPYVLPEWERAWPGLAGSYLELLAAVRAELGGELPLQVDLPVWWDERPIQRGGRTLSLSRAAMEQADQVVLMDYRNRADGILAGARDGLAIARELNRKVVIGLAVHCGPEAENARTSFCRLGSRSFLQVLGQVDRRLEGQPGYGGFAVFTYEDWLELRP